MSPLPHPAVAVAEVHEHFRAWWQREGFTGLEAAFGDRLECEQIQGLALVAYLQGQIDGAARAIKTVQEAFGLESCQFCGALLPPNPAPEDPVVAELGRICKSCLTDQAEARDLLE